MSDYIPRDVAIEAMYKDAEAHQDHTFWTSQNLALRNIPAADVRPVVKAVWEDASNPQWPAYDIRHCSCCGWNIPKSKLRAKDLNWHFCPNCGADMREANDEKA